MVKILETQEHELAAWLGDTPVTPMQFTELWRAANDALRAYPDDDQADDRAAALTRAAQRILGGA